MPGMGSRATSVRSVAYMEKASQYQKYLVLSSILLIITSTILIFTAVILMKFYHMTKLGFWSSYFETVPYYMITLGIYSFVLGLFGACITPLGNKATLIVFSVLMAIAFLAQLGSIFTALEVRTELENDDGYDGVHQEMKLYKSDPAVAAKWDALQTDMHCCGATGGFKGFRNWDGRLDDSERSVPDSCCRNQKKDCGKGMLDQDDEDIRQDIYTDGCVEILKDKLKEEVVPMMWVYAGIGVILAIIEIISVVLAAAYVAQINRRTSRFNASFGNWRFGDANVNATPDETDGTNGEEMKPFQGERSSLRDTVV